MQPSRLLSVAIAATCLASGLVLGVLLSGATVSSRSPALQHPRRNLQATQLFPTQVSYKARAPVLPRRVLHLEAVQGTTTFAPVNLTVPYSEYISSPHIKWQLPEAPPIPEGLKPSAVKDMYPRSPLTQPPSPVPFHWVIKTCARPMLGRFLSSSLLSGLFNGLQPATISIVWCKSKEKAGPLPTILYNLRHSLTLNVFYPSAELDDWAPGASTLTAFMVPQLLGAPELPLLITEDDVVYAPDANARIAAAIRRLQQSEQENPYMMTLYTGDLRAFNHSEPLDMDAIQSVPDDFNVTVVNSNDLVHEVQMGMNWGTQVQFFSPGMTDMLRGFFIKSHAAIAAKNTTDTHHQLSSGFLEDIIILHGVEKHYHCNQGSTPCRAFIVRQNLVQHIGTVSTLFSAGTLSNSRFHWSKVFPMHIKFPTTDKPLAWRR